MPEVDALICINHLENEQRCQINRVMGLKYKDLAFGNTQNESKLE